MTLIATLLHDATNERRLHMRMHRRKPVPSAPAGVIVKSLPTCTVSLANASVSAFSGKVDENVEREGERLGSRSSISFPSVEVTPVSVPAVAPVSFPAPLSSPSPLPSTSPPQQTQHALLRTRQRIPASFSSPSPSEEKNRRKRPGSKDSSSTMRKKARKSCSSPSSSLSSLLSLEEEDSDSECTARKGADRKSERKYGKCGKKDKDIGKDNGATAGGSGGRRNMGDLKLQVGSYRCLVGCLTRRCAVILERERGGDVAMDVDSDGDILDSGVPCLPSSSSSPSSSESSSMEQCSTTLEPLTRMDIEKALSALPIRTKSLSKDLETQDRLLAARLRAFLVWCGVDVEDVERDVARGFVEQMEEAGLDVEESLESEVEVEVEIVEENENVEARSSVPLSPSPSSSSLQETTTTMMDIDMEFPESDLRSVPGPGLIVVSSPSSPSSPPSTSSSDLDSSLADSESNTVVSSPPRPRPPRASPPRSPSPPSSSPPTPTPSHIIASLLIRHAGRARRRAPVDGEGVGRSPLRQVWS